MSGYGTLELLVTAGEQSFAETVSERLERVGRVEDVVTVESSATARSRIQDQTIDGVVVDDSVDDPIETVDRLAEPTDVSVVFLTDGMDDPNRLGAVLDAGAIDVFPRTPASAQCELIVERIEKADTLRIEGGTDHFAAGERPDPYREVFENVSDGLVVHDPETGAMVDVNERFCELNGYDREELLGESIGLVTAPGDEYSEAAAQEMIDRAREEGPQLFEWRNQRKNGATFPVEVHLAVVQIDGRERVLASVRDITERKERERKLQESERRFRLIAEHIDETIYLASGDFSEIQYINPAYEEIYGQPVEDLYENPRSFVEAAHPDDRERYEQDVRELIEDIDAGDPEDVYEGQYRLQRDGETRWVRVARFPVENEDGTVDRIVGRVQDVTERKRREREFEQIYDGVQDAIQIMDPETLEILDVNETYLEMFGYETVEAVREEGVAGISATEEGFTFERGLEIHQRVVETGEPEVLEWQADTASGERIWLELKVAPAVIGGEQRTIVVLRDITERKRRERIVRNLHESTDALQTAGTAADICEETVEVAEEVLNLSTTACWLDGGDDSEVLTPVAATDEARKLPQEGLPTLEPSDFAYSAYEDGKTGVHEPDALSDETPFDPALLVPLGEHGLLGAAEPDDEALGDVTIDAAQILARHATAALNRVEREQALRESERRFQLIAEHIDEIIYLATGDFSDILYINPAYEDIYGRSIEDLYENPRSFVEAAHPDDRDRYEQDVQCLIEDIESGNPDEVYEGGYRLQRDDETRWVRVARFPVENEDGTVDRIVGRVQDVTERKRREREFEQIFNSVTDPIAVYDPDTLELLDANEAFLDLVDHDDIESFREQGLTDHMMTGEGYTLERAREIHQRVDETGEPEMIDWEGRTRDGERISMEVKISPATIGGEEVTIASHRNVTEQRKFQRRFQTIANRVDEVIYLANIDLNEVLYVNDAYTDIWGRPVEELYENPRAFVENIHPDDVDEFTAKRQSMLEDIQSGTPDDSYDFSYRIQRPDGEMRWIETTGYPIVEEESGRNRYVAMVEDVTEKRQREQTLETFHEATRELTSADTHEGACQQAVQAAQDVLGFPLVAAYLYDDTSGTLEPSAITTRLETLDVDLRSFGPGDSLPWQVFVEGEAVTEADSAVDIYGPGLSPPDVIVPLGSHGVMLVGSPGADFDSGEVELAQILAATLEAALNHIAGERTLEEREAELQRQQERAARLEQLNTIIRDIERVTIEQSSRADIEAAVCERLMAVDAHELVWIGESTVGGEELSIRSKSDSKDAYVDALSGELASDAVGHPAFAVQQTDEPQFLENIATDVPPGEWRTAALRHGIQSVMSVPIRYESTLHGVLTVASDEPDAFDEATRNVLAELGQSIGYAITVTEREAALESEGTTEIEFDVDDDGLFLVRASGKRSCEVRLERTIRRAGGSFSMVYRVDGAEPEALADIARAAPSVEQATVISTDDDEKHGLIDVTAPTWFGSVFTDHGAVLREATAENGTGTILVEAPRGVDVRALVEGFQERYPDCDLAAQRQRERTIRSLFELQDILQEEVTDRQWEALETAYSAGYFSWPRETSGEEVAELIGVTQPTFNKHIRIAEQAAFRLLLEREFPDEE